MMNYKLLETLIEQKRYTQKIVAESVGMSRAGFMRMVKEKTMKVETLEQLSDFLDVPVSDFFGKEKKKQNYPSNTIQSELKEGNINQIISIDEMEMLLTELVKAKDQVIEMQREKIANLERKLQDDGNGSGISQTGN